VLPETAGGLSQNQEQLHYLQKYSNVKDESVASNVASVLET
jgi:hypothetical protein